MSRSSLRRDRLSSGDGAYILGWPAMERLMPVFAFLILPAILVLAITLNGGNWPTSILYPIAMVLGLVESAKRCMDYMLIGSVLQPNSFGGSVAYTLLPFLAIFHIYIKDLRAWLLTPYFLLAAKVLISTFSHGAYLAMVIGGLMAGWYTRRADDSGGPSAHQSAPHVAGPGKALTANPAIRIANEIFREVAILNSMRGCSG